MAAVTCGTCGSRIEDVTLDESLTFLRDHPCTKPVVEPPRPERRELPSNELLTAEEAAQIIGVEVKTLWNWCSAQRRGESRGQFAPPFIKMGSRLRFRRREVDEWLRAKSGSDGTP